MLGVAPKSGTAWRQTEALLQESHSLFELMTENKGLAIEEMLREFIIPHLKKKMDTSKEISVILEANEISKIDQRYIKNKSIQVTNEQIKEKILSGETIEQGQPDMMLAQNTQQIEQGLQEQGNQRFFKPSEIPDKTWKEALKDLEWEVEVDVTNENIDKDAATTLNTLLQFFQAKQGMPMTPEERFVVEKILRFTGTVSTLELANIPKSPMPVMPPQGSSVGQPSNLIQPNA
jgi:hypothetical protein